MPPNASQEAPMGMPPKHASQEEEASQETPMGMVWACKNCLLTPNASQETPTNLPNTPLVHDPGTVAILAEGRSHHSAMCQRVRAPDTFRCGNHGLFMLLVPSLILLLFFLLLLLLFFLILQILPPFFRCSR